MTYKFFPHTEEDLKEMLAKAGVSSLDGLYAEVPESIKFKGDYDLPEAKSELEIRKWFKALGEKNTTFSLFRTFVLPITIMIYNSIFGSNFEPQSLRD